MILELGARGDYVRAVQRIVGVPASKVDGVFGPFTEALVCSWQARRGVEADGVFGPLSRAVVEAPDLIKAFEGLVLQAYDDAQDVPLAKRLLKRVGQEWRRLDGTPCRRYPTIGYGRRLWPGQWIETCTKAQAEQWLLDFIKEQLGDLLARYLPADVDGAQRAAVTVLGYNRPKAIIDLAAAKFDETWWRTHVVTSNGVREAGLVMRRAEEAALFHGLAAA